ncbi:class II aldolase/adducin family protein [Streptomyces sp. 3N207]|uniref:class II aldolase/adducin family protein n=1 Tax=Streptomyces sp. 3N207 TaxID=3457417 RepID=UPI003FD235D0
MSSTTLSDRDVEAAKVELAAAFRAAAQHGFHEGIDNHFSLVVPGQPDHFLLNRFGPHWSEMQPHDLLTIDADGRVVDGEGEWERSAFSIHLAAHRTSADATCVLHTHMPYATAVSMTEHGLDTRSSQNAMIFHGRYARLSFGGIADDEEEGQRIASALISGASVIMLDGHGVLIVGASVAEAWYKLYFLERAWEAQVLAMSTGSPLIRVPEERATRTASQWDVAGNPDALFAAVCRRLDDSVPGA